MVPGANEPEGQADPLAVALIEAGGDPWQEVEPAVYSTTVSITFVAPMQGSCPTEQPLLIVVTDGVVTSAINSARGCRLDTGHVSVGRGLRLRHDQHGRREP